jgi:hypothetical protein
MKFLPLHVAVGSLVAVTTNIVSSAVVIDAASSSSSSTSFVRDVMGKVSPSHTHTTRGGASLNDALLAKAVPLDQYKAKLRSQGLRLQEDVSPTADGNTVVEMDVQSSRKLDQAKYYYYNYNDDGAGNAAANDDQQQEENEVQQNEDDYYVADGNYISFSGFALKYAKCQPVQHFSENAVNSGEYSPMVLDDIVILRLCPSLYCSTSRAYGCFYDYADYAIHATDYIRIMLRYKMDREEQLCDFCQACASGNGRRRAEQYNNYYNVDDYNTGDDAAAANDDGYGYGSACNGFGQYCLDEDGYPVCDYDNGGENANNGDDGSYKLDAEGYLQLIDCVQVEGGYFIRPRCDGYTEKLSMGIFHDKFCSQYAGDSIDIGSFNLGIDKSYFKEFSTEAGCMDCSKSVRTVTMLEDRRLSSLVFLILYLMKHCVFFDTF